MTRRTSQLMTLAAALFALVVILAPVIALAQTSTPPTAPQAKTSSGGGILSGLFGIGDIAASAVAWLSYIVGYLIATIGGVAIAFITYFIEIFLQINTFIPETLAVREGFGVFLSLANLTFVFGIIVVALATIVRYQTYGIKQILWKLIVMAVAVNFSMALVTTVMRFSDGLSLYLMRSTLPTSNLTSEQSRNFASALAAAFQPQKLFLDTSVTNQKFGTDPASISKASGLSLTDLISPIINIVFVVFALIGMIISLGTLAAMLLIRYLYLTILLIVMPLAWTGWVFPNLRGWWSQWWSKFIQQVFFPPAVLFFLYLTIRTSEAMRDANITNEPLKRFLYDPAAGGGIGALEGVKGIVGSFVGEFASTIMQAIVMVGLSIGGMWAAKSLNVKFADKAMGTMGDIGKSFGNYVGRRTRQAATTPLRSDRVKNWASNLQQTGAGRGFFGRLATLPVRYAGRGLEAATVAEGEKQLEAARKRIGGLTTPQKISGLTTMTAPERLAALQDIQKEGQLSAVKNIDRYLGKDQEKLFTKYGQGKNFGVMRGESGLALRDLVQEQQDIEAGKEILDTDGKKKTTDTINKEIIDHFKSAASPGQLAETFFQDIDRLRKKAGGNAGEKNLVLGMNEEGISQMQKAIVKGIGEGFTGNNMNKFFEKLSRGDQLEQFQKVAESIRGSTDGQIKVSERNINWLNGNAAQNLGIGPELFGHERKPQKTKRAPKEQSSKRGDVESAPVIIPGTDENFRAAKTAASTPKINPLAKP